MGTFLDKATINLLSDENRHVGSRNGALSYKRVLVRERNGFGVMLQRYCAGNVSPAHTHSCGHGMYVLAGTLHTNFGDFDPGSFVWFAAGVPMEHGATDGDVDVLFVTDAPFDITYLPEGATLPADDPRFHGVRGEGVRLAYRLEDAAHAYGRATLYESPTLGFAVKRQHFEPDSYTPWHTHGCGHGMYVLGGTLATDRGSLAAGSFVWFDAGERMEHGTRDAPADLVFITDGPFDIAYVGEGDGAPRRREPTKLLMQEVSKAAVEVAFRPRLRLQ